MPDLGPHAHRLEHVAALAACLLVSIYISRRLLRPEYLSADALVHQYWMWQFRDPALFTDALTADLRDSARYPGGYVALFHVVTPLVDPIAFGEWLGVGLMAVSGWLVFLVVREHTAWRPAAWLAAGLFLILIDIHRFHGGFPRGFVHPVVLLTVLLALRRRHPAAALVAAGGAWFYPPASLLAVGVLLVSTVRWSGRRPGIDRRRAAYAGLASVLAAAFVLVPRLVQGAAPAVLTGDEARGFPEFGPNGALHFFVPSTLEYLTQNRSGVDLRLSGTILALAALGLLAIRPANLRLLRTEVLAIPVVSLGAFAVAQAVLFELYLPHRYTYPLVAFFAIVVGVGLRPTWTALWERRGASGRAFALLAAPVALAAIALVTLPVGRDDALEYAQQPRVLVALAAAVGVAAVAALLLRRAGGPARSALAASLCGLLLLGVLYMVPERGPRGTLCPPSAASAYLATVPKDAVIAGDPIDLRCLPATARRPVVISTQLAPSYEADYFRKGRARMFADLQAYYGPSAAAIVALNRRYGATHLWVRRRAVERELNPPGARWRRWEQPYGRFVRGVLRSGRPAVLSLPAACRTWKHGSDEVYDIACLA